MNELTIEMWPIERPIAYARNARVCPESAIAKVAASLKEFGFRQPIVVDAEGVNGGTMVRQECPRELGGSGGVATVLEVPMHDDSSTRSLFSRWADKVDIGDDCWNWQASTTHNGYGNIHADGVTKRAHRVGYELFVGSIPPGMVLLHRCDNRLCVNPSHLELGTVAENQKDMAAKGRGSGGRARGERNGLAKLTAEDVRIIRAELRRGALQRELAERYGVDQTNISAIKLGKTWAES